MSYTLHWEAGGVHYQLHGRVDYDVLTDGSDKISGDPRFPSVTYVITDFLGAEEFVVSKYEALLLASHDHWASKSNPLLKMAIVTDRDDIVEAAYRYSNSEVIKHNLRVMRFSNLEDARAWVAEA